jgi:hypothetical protein
MNAQPIQPDTLLDDLHPKRFLQVSDLLERWQVQQMTVRVTRMNKEETVPNPKDIDPQTNKPRIVWQPVIYFKIKGRPDEWPSGYLLSAQIDVQSLKSSTGARTSGEVIGKKIIIFVGEHRKQAVLRISPVPPEPEPEKK